MKLKDLVNLSTEKATDNISQISEETLNKWEAEEPLTEAVDAEVHLSEIREMLERMKQKNAETKTL